MINGSHDFSLEELIHLNHYGFVETRFLVFLCNYIHNMQKSCSEEQFIKYFGNVFCLKAVDLADQFGILLRDARRILKHTDRTFNSMILDGFEKKHIDWSEYISGSLHLKLSKYFLDLFNARNPYLYDLSLSELKNINSIYPIRFLNYLNAQDIVNQVEITLSLEELKIIFGIEQNYTCLSNLRSKVIGKSIEFISNFTTYHIMVHRKLCFHNQNSYTFLIERKSLE